MSVPRIAQVAALLVLGLVSLAAPGREGEEPVVRQVYAVRGGSAKDLASALALHFQAERSFRAVPDAGSNTLLLSGSKAVLEDATAVLRAIDRPAQGVRVEVLFLELTTRTGDEKGGDARPLDVAELSGPVREVRARVRDLQQKGVVSGVKAVELSALTGDSARTQVTESKPYVTGVSGGRGATAPMNRVISYRNVGTSVQVKPAVGADGQVILDLHIEDSTMRAAEGAAVGTDEKGASIPATEFVTFTLENRVRLRPGQFVLAEGSRTGTRAGQVQVVVLVTASMEGANPDSGK
jgi:type II secretory pathway component GspD/PulD (secretin)